MKSSRRQFVLGATAVSAVATLDGIEMPFGYAENNGPHLDCDVLVYGATPSGIAAAVTAARHGHKVILVDSEDHIGGIIANGLTNTDLHPAHRGAVGGFFDEFTERIIAHYRATDIAIPGMASVSACHDGMAYEPSVAESVFNQLLAEQGSQLQLLLHYEMKLAILRDRKVTGAIFKRIDRLGHEIQIDAPVLIDATYEGDLGALAKAEFRLGRESREEFSERHAGVIYMKIGTQIILPGSTGSGDSAIQAYCFRFTATTDPVKRVPIERPQNYDRGDYRFLLEDLKSGRLKKFTEVVQAAPLPNEKFCLNNNHTSPVIGVPSESLDQAEDSWTWPAASRAERRKIYARCLAYDVGLIWMLQNDSDVPHDLQQEAQRFGWCKDEFAQNNYVPRQVYVREGRRIIGEYLLTEHDGDLAQGWERTRVQQESIAVAEWGFDCHGCHKYDPAHPGTREGYILVDHPVLQIPYGVVVPKVVDGLLVPVACSATHVAYNPVRLEPVFMALGEASGHAAHLALSGKSEVREVKVEELQQLLVANGGVITYLSDLENTSPAFAACQWLGARGFNKGYLAEVEKLLTQEEALDRFDRVLGYMKHPWSRPVLEEPSRRLRRKDVTAWLQRAGFSTAQEWTSQLQGSQADQELTVGDFACQLKSAFSSIHPTTQGIVGPAGGV